MQKLVCEICGGKLLAKENGIFECDSCGLQYDKTKIQQMVQEIRGTVAVEGTVNVQGTVKVEGIQNVDSFLYLGFKELVDGNPLGTIRKENAEKHFINALSIDSNCGEALLGLLMCKYNKKDRAEFWKYIKSIELEERNKFEALSDYKKNVIV